MGEEAAEMQCAICFDTISERTVLPCACNVDYCLRCWDHALAASFNVGEHARCPSCRMPVRVDFDSNTCRLVFSRETEELPANPEESANVEGAEDELEQLRNDILRNRAEGVDDQSTALQSMAQRFMALTMQVQEQYTLRERHHGETIERIAKQAIPAMTRLLEQYRATHDVPIEGYLQNPEVHLKKLPIGQLKAEIKCMGGSCEGCLETSDLAKRLVDTANSQGIVASLLASTTLEAPPCVCGSSLVRFDSEERTRHFLRKMGVVDETAMARQMQALIASGSTHMICDLCDDHIPFKSFVWTCKNDNTTIIHATTYDVCDPCFIRYACAVAV